MDRYNKLMGINAQTKDELERAKDVDLITFPLKIDGTNCGNCQFIKKGYCENERVDQRVNNRMCCVLWSAPGEYRQFEGREDIYE